MKKVVTLCLALLFSLSIFAEFVYNTPEEPLHVVMHNGPTEIKVIIPVDTICAKTTPPAPRVGSKAKPTDFTKTEFIVMKGKDVWRTDCITFHGNFVVFIDKSNGMEVVCVPDVIKEAVVVLPPEAPPVKKP
jgi:hypothetical protein